MTALPARLASHPLTHSTASSAPSRGAGRAFLDARPLTAAAPALPDVVHGSALVACGSTQALATATLDALATAQTIDAFAGGAKTKRCVAQGGGTLRPAGALLTRSLSRRRTAHMRA